MAKSPEQKYSAVRLRATLKHCTHSYNHPILRQSMNLLLLEVWVPWWEIFWCEELFSGLIDFHDVTNLVWYIKTTKHCKIEIVALSKFSCMCSKSSNAAVSSGKTFYKFHAILPSELPPLNQYFSWRVMLPVSTVIPVSTARSTLATCTGAWIEDN